MAKSNIKNIKAREILDSRGNPTIEAEVETGFGIFKASVPSGTSKGKYEALELRDGGERYGGKGVLKAVNNINTIIKRALLNKDSRKQKDIDLLMVKLDGSKNKSRLGANAILSVSMAVCRAGAFANGLPLYKHISQLSEKKKLFSKQPKLAIPTPSILMIEGSAHAGNNLDFQEFMILCWANSFKEKLRKGVEIYHQLGKILQKEYGESSINTGMEGGYSVSFANKTEEVLQIIKRAVAELRFENDTRFAIDCAASSFYNNGKYLFEGKTMSQQELFDFYINIFKNYPIYSLEDPFSEDDVEGFKKITDFFKEQGETFFITGDDLLASNPERITVAIQNNLCNSMILKPNQIGTITESIIAANLAKKYNWKIMVSHRSGETYDDFIADFSVGIGADYVKFGAPSHGERVAKYNRLLKIEEEL